MMCRYNGGLCTHCSDVYMYLLVYCRMFLYPLSHREAFGPLSLHRIVIVHGMLNFFTELSNIFRYDIVASLSNEKMETFDTISNRT